MKCMCLFSYHLYLIQFYTLKKISFDFKQLLLFTELMQMLLSVLDHKHKKNIVVQR